MSPSACSTRRTQHGTAAHCALPPKKQTKKSYRVCKKKCRETRQVMKAVTPEEVFGHSALIKTINDRFRASSEFFFVLFFCPNADKTRAHLKVNGWRPQLCLLLSRLPLTAHHLDARLEEKKQCVVGEVGVLFFSLFFVSRCTFQLALIIPKRRRSASVRRLMHRFYAQYALVCICHRSRRPIRIHHCWKVFSSGL